VSGTFFCVFRRDLALALRRKSEALNTLVFFVIVTSLFPLGIGAEPNLLREIAPGILWVAALLAALLSLGRLFEPDYADGTLEQMAMVADPFPLIVLAKIAAHWVMTGLPLTLLAPVIALQFDLPADSIALLFFTLLIGTPVLSLLGAIAAALTLGLRGGGVLSALLVLPLYIPLLIFGAGATGAAAAGVGGQAHLLLLGSFLLASMALSPWATASALRIALD
jgi:heme exporter protein B